jgi:hypothetical protein
MMRATGAAPSAVSSGGSGAQVAGRGACALARGPAGDATIGYSADIRLWSLSNRTGETAATGRYGDLPECAASHAPEPTQGGSRPRFRAYSLGRHGGTGSVSAATVNPPMLCSTNIIRRPSVIRLPAVESVTGRKSCVSGRLRASLAVGTLTGRGSGRATACGEEAALPPVAAFLSNKTLDAAAGGRSGYARSSPSFFRYVRHPRISGSVRCALHPT